MVVAEPIPVLEGFPELRELGPAMLQTLCDEWLRTPIARKYRINKVKIGVENSRLKISDFEAEDYQDPLSEVSDAAHLPWEDLLNFLIERGVPAEHQARMKALVRSKSTRASSFRISTHPLANSSVDDLRAEDPHTRVFSLKVAWSFDAFARLLPLIGRINVAEFEGRPAESVLFVGPEHANGSAIGSLYFLERPQSFNRISREDTGRWEEIRHVATNTTLYEPADFSVLSAMKI